MCREFWRSPTTTFSQIEMGVYYLLVGPLSLPRSGPSLALVASGLVDVSDDRRRWGRGLDHRLLLLLLHMLLLL